MDYLLEWEEFNTGKTIQENFIFLIESTESKEEKDFLELLKRIEPAFIDNKYVQNAVDNKKVDFYKVAPDKYKEILFNDYLNFDDDKLSKYSEDQKRDLFNSNIISFKLFLGGKLKDNKIGPKSKKLSLKQWAKLNGRNINDVGLEKDYKLYKDQK